jgi:hypothetical protein
MQCAHQIFHISLRQNCLREPDPFFVVARAPDLSKRDRGKIVCVNLKLIVPSYVHQISPNSFRQHCVHASEVVCMQWKLMQNHRKTMGQAKPLIIKAKP